MKWHISPTGRTVSKDLTHISKYEHRTTYSFVPEWFLYFCDKPLECESTPEKCWATRCRPSPWDTNLKLHLVHSGLALAWLGLSHGFEVVTAWGWSGILTSKFIFTCIIAYTQFMFNILVLILRHRQSSPSSAKYSAQLVHSSSSAVHLTQCP